MKWQDNIARRRKKRTRTFCKAGPAGALPTGWRTAAGWNVGDLITVVDRKGKKTQWRPIEVTYLKAHRG